MRVRLEGRATVAFISLETNARLDESILNSNQLILCSLNITNLFNIKFKSINLTLKE